MTSRARLVINEDEFQRHFMAYEDLALEVVDDFLRLLPKMVANIEVGLQACSHEKIEEAAHTLKGAAANFFAEKVIETSRQLEEMSHNKAQIPEMRPLVIRLHNETRDLAGTLAALLKQRNES